MACANKGGAKRIAVDKPKVKVFSRRRKYLRQTNGVSDQRKRFAVAAAGAKSVKDNVYFVGATSGRPRFVKKLFVSAALLQGWTGDRWSPLQGAVVVIFPYLFESVFGCAGFDNQGSRKYESVMATTGRPF